MSRVHAVILAGGLGSRLGNVRKADLLFNGVRLLDSVARRLSGISGQLLVSVGRHASIQLPDGMMGIPDAGEHSEGPLAGIAAGARFLESEGCASDLLISVAVDSPFLPEDYVARLATTSGDAAYACFGETIYPTNAAWRVGVLRRALEEHAANAGPRTLLRTIAAEPIDWSASCERDPFANINSLAELLAFQRLSRHVSPKTNQAAREGNPPNDRTD